MWVTEYGEGVRLVGPRTNEVLKEEVKPEPLSYEAEIRLEWAKQRKEIRKRQHTERPGNNTEE